MKFLLGMAGGIAPEVLRFYQARRKYGGKELKTLFYWAVTIAFMLLAGLLAQLLATDNAIAAFTIGVQTPFVIRGMEAAGAKKFPGTVTEIEEAGTDSTTGAGRTAFRLRRTIRLLSLH